MSDLIDELEEELGFANDAIEILKEERLELRAKVSHLETEIEKLKHSNHLYYESSEKDLAECELLHEQIERLRKQLERRERRGK